MASGLYRVAARGSSQSLAQWSAFYEERDFDVGNQLFAVLTYRVLTTSIAIAHAPSSTGGKIGGITSMFRPETTVLGPSQNVLWAPGILSEAPERHP
jgi:hypothetical protein